MANDDLISRQAAIDAFRKELCRERVYATPFISFKGCERILNELPSAERHGRWDNGFCSVCGAEALTEWNDTGGEYAFTTFCPNCGADMREAKNGCDDCFVPMLYNLEDDDSICRDCEAGE